MPLALVVAAALYAPLSQKYGWTYPTFFSSDYPVKLDLEEIAQLTRQRDSARSVNALHSMAEEAEPVAALMMPVTLLPDPDGLPVTENGPDGSTQVAPPAVRNAEPQSGIGLMQGGVLALDFNLAGDANRAGMLELRKTVQFEDAALGQLAIRIDDTSRIFVSRGDLMRVIPAALRPSGSLEGDFIPLQQLRDSGVDLRYDPLNDRFVLSE